MSAAEVSTAPSASTTPTTVDTLETAPARPRGGLSLRFLRSELQIIFGRRRNIAGLAVLAVVPIILAIAVSVSSPGGDGPDFISAITGNGLFVAIAALGIELPLFLPLAVATISGDSIAGEANIGTLRYL
jgi:ABC-2 type transport system permease protein